MPSAMDLPVGISDLKRIQETPIVTVNPGEIYLTLMCEVKCPMIRQQWYSTLQKPILGYQPQVG